jgi:hypothetical protein
MTNDPPHQAPHPRHSHGWNIALYRFSAGSVLPEVAQLLPHRSEAATALYATVDRVSLDLVVRPWPGAGR